jgi:hypothetical protein
MMRLTEQLEGTGAVFERAAQRGDVRYHIRVYQQVQGKGKQVPGLAQRVEGSVSALADSSFDVFDVWQRGADLELHLEDGRTLEFQLSSSAGALIATSRVKSTPP